MTNIEYVKQVMGSYKDLEELADSVYGQLQQNEAVADMEVYEAADRAYNLYDFSDSVDMRDFLWGDSEWVEAILNEMESLVEGW